MSAGCPNCGYVRPANPRLGRPRRYDVSDLAVGESRVFEWTSQGHLNSIRAAICYAGRRDARHHKTRVLTRDTVRITRTA